MRKVGVAHHAAVCSADPYSTQTPLCTDPRRALLWYTLMVLCLQGRLVQYHSTVSHRDADNMKYPPHYSYLVHIQRG